LIGSLYTICTARIAPGALNAAPYLVIRVNGKHLPFLKISLLWSFNLPKQAKAHSLPTRGVFTNRIFNKAASLITSMLVMITVEGSVPSTSDIVIETIVSLYTFTCKFAARTMGRSRLT
ncbi:hypothetical protein RvY_13052, partial [Ramazzottius varieornatus]